VAYFLRESAKGGEGCKLTFTLGALCFLGQGAGVKTKRLLVSSTLGKSPSGGVGVGNWVGRRGGSAICGPFQPGGWGGEGAKEKRLYLIPHRGREPMKKKALKKGEDCFFTN